MKKKRTGMRQERSISTWELVEVSIDELAMGADGTLVPVITKAAPAYSYGFGFSGCLGAGGGALGKRAIKFERAAAGFFQFLTVNSMAWAIGSRTRPLL